MWKLKNEENGDLSSYPEMSIKGKELSHGREPTSQPINNNKSINQFNNDNLLQHFLVFQLVFNNFSTLSPSPSQVLSNH